MRREATGTKPFSLVAPRVVTKAQRGWLCGTPGEFELRALRFPGLEEPSNLVGDRELKNYMVPLNNRGLANAIVYGDHSGMG